MTCMSPGFAHPSRGTSALAMHEHCPDMVAVEMMHMGVAAHMEHICVLKERPSTVESSLHVAVPPAQSEWVKQPVFFAFCTPQVHCMRMVSHP